MRKGTSENSWSRSTSWHWHLAAGKNQKNLKTFLVFWNQIRAAGECVYRYLTLTAGITRDK
jgi:hypothetical protein